MSQGYQTRQEGRIPSYKFVKISTRTAFLDVSDSNPPFLQEDIYPSLDDTKNSKFQISLTLIKEGGPNLFLRHYVDRKQLLTLCHNMLAHEQGDPENDYLPGFPEYKGSPDKLYPDWPVTSRIFGVKYQKAAKFGPAYILEMSAGRGKQSQNGAVMPDGTEGRRSASMHLPLFGNSKMPPLAQYFAREALNYLEAREVSRQVGIANSIRDLRYQIGRGDKESEHRLNQILDGLYGPAKSDGQGNRSNDRPADRGRDDRHDDNYFD